MSKVEKRKVKLYVLESNAGDPRQMLWTPVKDSIVDLLQYQKKIDKGIGIFFKMEVQALVHNSARIEGNWVSGIGLFSTQETVP